MFDEMHRIERYIQTKANRNSYKPEKQLAVRVSVDERTGRPRNVAKGIYPTVPPRISSLAKGSSKNLSSHITMPFTPQERGREETIQLLETGTYGSLTALLTQRNQAAKQVRRGPRTTGTREVQTILREPSRKSVQSFHAVRLRAEMELHYGVPGLVAYNFSKTVGWNRDAAMRVPSLQLNSMIPSLPPIRPYTPIRWLQLPEPELESKEKEKEEKEKITDCWSPLTEPGGWREDDIGDTRLDSLYGESLAGSLSSGDSEHSNYCIPDERIDGWREGEHDPDDVNVEAAAPLGTEARAVTITPVSSAQIRQVDVVKAEEKPDGKQLY
jgi:hypothetical protein